METKRLAEFLMTIRPETLDASTVNYAKMCVEDLVGVAIAGSAAEVGTIWARYSLAEPMTPGAFGAACWNGAFTRAEYRTAAAYNAACGHLLDLDDLHKFLHRPSSGGNGAGPRLPWDRNFTVAVGRYWRLSWLGMRLERGWARPINPEAYWFWHTTGVVGSYASATAAGMLLRLEEEQLLSTLGNAGTQSAGLWEFMENGSMSKSLHTANATLCGLRAAGAGKAGLYRCPHYSGRAQGLCKSPKSQRTSKRRYGGAGDTTL